MNLGGKHTVAFKLSNLVEPEIGGPSSSPPQVTPSPLLVAKNSLKSSIEARLSFASRLTFLSPVAGGNRIVALGPFQRACNMKQ